MINSQTANEEVIKEICEIATIDTGSLKQAGAAVKTMRKTCRNEHKHLLQKSFKPVATRAKKVLTEMRTEVTSISNRGNLLIGNYEKARYTMRKQWEKYESITEQGLMSQATADGAKQIDIDPFIEGKRYDKCTRDYSSAVKAFHRGMGKLQRELNHLDQCRVEKTKRILLEYFLAEKAKAMMRIRTLDASLEEIQTIRTASPSKQNLETTEQCDFEMPKSSTKARAKVTKLIYADVIKWGEICMPGGFLYTSWKQVHAIITKFGFFHCFQSREALGTLLSVKLGPDVLVDINLKDKRCFTVTSPKTGFFSRLGVKIYTFQTKSLQETTGWVTALKDGGMYQQEIVRNNQE